MELKDIPLKGYKPLPAVAPIVKVWEEWNVIWPVNLTESEFALLSLSRLEYLWISGSSFVECICRYTIFNSFLPSMIPLSSLHYFHKPLEYLL